MAANTGGHFRIGPEDNVRLPGGELAKRRGISFVNFRPCDGMIPDWHQNSDTADQVDVDVLEKTQNYIWEILQTLDQGA